ncbi:Hypothetical predicted protein [Paramuricea clavata]|uniref:Uncharacterized protein n=1 Tax=Paramuricea clavata TaxID=317549 RepID=A0A6S7K7D3_PARCT|nr:Hypothetical predicted protein [Paramuricea clavata]
MDEEEFLLLWTASKYKNPDFPVECYTFFNMDEKHPSEVNYKAEFRYEKKDIPYMAEVLRIPYEFKCRQGTVCDGMTGLCIVLKRLTHPCHFGDMISSFWLSVPELCMIYNTAIDRIFNEHSDLVSQWNNTFLGAEKLQNYVLDSVAAKGAALRNCFGFVHGTKNEGMTPECWQTLCIYGDPAYPLTTHLQAPFRQVPITAETGAFNKSMSNVRVAVE